MKIKLIHRQILDEREEQLVNKAGMETLVSCCLVVWPYMLDRWL